LLRITFQVVVEPLLDLKLHYVADVEALVPSFFFKTLNIFRCNIIWIIESSCL